MRPAGGRGEALPRGGRAAADAVAAVLGLNVWVSLVFVPGLFVGAFRHAPFGVFLAMLGLAVLSAGLVWRSQLILLFLYPAALLLPITYDVRIVSAGVYGPITFSVVAASLLAYLLGVSFLSAFRAPPPPGRVRKLSSASQPLPARWKRRFRIYAALAALSALYPTVLLYSVSFSPTNRLYLKELYPGRVAPMMALLDLGVLAVWLAVFGLYFLGVLRQHRTGDRALQQELERIRAEARRGVPRPIFYVAVVCALAFMGLLVLLRYR